MNLQSVFLVGLGGFIGTLARYIVGLSLISLGARPIWSTLTVNILGSLAIGWVLSFGVGKWSESTALILTVGVLGGFTTFSAFSADAILLLKNGNHSAALIYVSAMLAFSLLAAYLGFLLGSIT